MSDRDARTLERTLRRDGKLHGFVLLALEEMGDEDLGLVLDRTMELMLQRHKSPAREALERGVQDHGRLVSGEITPGQLCAELQEKPLRQEHSPGLSPARGAEVTRVVRLLLGMGRP